MASGDYIVGRDIDFQYASEPAEPPLAELDATTSPEGDAHESVSTSKKKRKKRKKKSNAPVGELPVAAASAASTSSGPVASNPSQIAATEQMASAPATTKKGDIWNTSSEEERQRIREFWTKLGDPERMKLVRLDKDLLLQKVRRQRRDCACSVCGRKREAVEQELEMLYEAYYSELESYSARLLLGGSELANDLEYDEDLLFDSFSAKARPPLKRDDDRQQCKRHSHGHHNGHNYGHNHSHAHGNSHNHGHNHPHTHSHGHELDHEPGAVDAGPHTPSIDDQLSLASSHAQAQAQVQSHPQTPAAFEIDIPQAQLDLLTKQHSHSSDSAPTVPLPSLPSDPALRQYAREAAVLAAREDMLAARTKLQQPAAKAAAAAAFKESSQKLANALGPDSPLAGGIISMADDILHNEGKRVLDVMERIENGRLRSDDPQFASLLYESYMQARGQGPAQGNGQTNTNGHGVGQAVVAAATATVAAYGNDPNSANGNVSEIVEGDGKDSTNGSANGNGTSNGTGDAADATTNDAAELIYKLGFPRNVAIPEFPGMGDIPGVSAATEAAAEAAAAVTAAALNGDAPFGGPLELQHLQHLQHLQRQTSNQSTQKQYLKQLLRQHHDQLQQQHNHHHHQTGPYDRVIAAAVEEYEDDEYDEYDDEDLDDEDLDDEDDEDLEGSGYATDDNYGGDAVPRRHLPSGDIDEDADEYDDDYDEEDYDSADVEGDDGLSPEAREEQRLQEGRRMLQVFAARMFEQRIMQAYREHVARERQQRLLEELEEESRQAVEREAKKLKDKERKKSKKLAAKQQREEEQRRKEQEEQARAEQQRLKEEQQRQAQRELEKSKAEAHRREIEARMEKMERANKEREERERKQRERERDEREKVEREEKEREQREQIEREQREKRKSESPKAAAKTKAKAKVDKVDKVEKIEKVEKVDKTDKKPKESKKTRKDKEKERLKPQSSQTTTIGSNTPIKPASTPVPAEDSLAQQQQRLNEHMQGLRMAASTSPRTSFSPVGFNGPAQQPQTASPSPSPLGFGMGRQGSISSPFAGNIGMGSGLNSVKATNLNGVSMNGSNMNGSNPGNNLFNPLIGSGFSPLPSAGMWSNNNFAKPASQASWGWSPWTPAQPGASPPPAAVASSANSMWATSSSLDAIRQSAISSYARIVRDGLAVDGFVPSQVLYHATVDALGGVSFSQNDMYQACGVATGARGDFDCLRDSVGLVTHMRYGRAT